MRVKNIYKTPNGKYRAFILFFGKTRTKVCESYQEAVSWKKEQHRQREQIKEKAKRGYLPFATCPEFFNGLIDQYLELSPPFPKTAITFWKRHFERVRVVELTRAHFLLGKEKLLKEGYKAATINLYLTFIRQVVKKANLKYEFPSLSVLEVLKNESPPPFRNRILKPEEIERLMEAAKKSSSPWFYDFLKISFKTALRKKELLHLTFEDCDFKNKHIWIRNTKNKRERVIPMAKEVEEILLKLKKQTNSPYIFGKKYTNGALHPHFKKACVQAGIKDFLIHDIRHNVITFLGHEGVDIKQIQHFAGHTHQQMTDRYLHFSKLYGHDEIKKKLDG